MIYRLELPRNNTTALDFDSMVMANQMKPFSQLSQNELLVKIHRLPYDNVSVDSLWNGEQLFFKFNSECLDDFDINVVGTFLFLKFAAYEILKPLMIEFGEFLKVKTDRGDLMMFNLMTFAAENTKQTLYKYCDGFEDGLKSLIFDEIYVNKKSLFKSKLEGGNLIYCNEDFYYLVKKKWVYRYYFLY
tara:strand:- start:813 stop:1376 length:564 start_codon:yes stop_codon:yes gene_type:complete